MNNAPTSLAIITNGLKEIIKDPATKPAQKVAAIHMLDKIRREQYQKRMANAERKAKAKLPGEPSAPPDPLA